MTIIKLISLKLFTNTPLRIFFCVCKQYFYVLMMQSTFAGQSLLQTVVVVYTVAQDTRNLLWLILDLFHLNFTLILPYLFSSNIFYILMMQSVFAGQSLLQTVVVVYTVAQDTQNLLWLILDLFHLNFTLTVPYLFSF